MESCGNECRSIVERDTIWKLVCSAEFGLAELCIIVFKC
jgi:hypothetical protein